MRERARLSELREVVGDGGSRDNTHSTPVQRPSEVLPVKVESGDHLYAVVE